MVHRREVDDSDGRSRLCCRAAGSGHALLDAWHNDQDRAGVLAIEDITHLLQSGSVETLRFLRNHELQVFPGHHALLCAPMLASAEADAAEQLVDL